MSPELQLKFQAVLIYRYPPLVQPGGHALQDLALHAFQCWPAPQREGRPVVTQAFGDALLGGRSRPADRQLLETREVDARGRGLDDIARQLRHDYVIAEEPSQA